MVFSNIRNGQKWSSIFNELFSDRRNSDERRVPRDNCSIPGSFFFGFLLAAPPPTPPVKNNLQTFNTKTNLIWCLFFFNTLFCMLCMSYIFDQYQLLKITHCRETMMDFLSPHPGQYNYLLVCFVSVQGPGRRSFFHLHTWKKRKLVLEAALRLF